MINALVESIRKRFRGLLQTLQMLPASTTPDLFEQLLFPAAAVMDPAYGFVWLDADYPGSPEVKASIKVAVMGKTLQILLL